MIQCTANLSNSRPTVLVRCDSDLPLDNCSPPKGNPDTCLPQEGCACVSEECGGGSLQSISHCPLTQYTLHHTHLHSCSHLDVMLTGGPVVFPSVCGGCPSPAPPPAAAAVRWLWLRHLGCQEGGGTARGHPQELENRGAV